ncbi:hypothetical protein D3C77_576860 [compost metagenome]
MTGSDLLHHRLADSLQVSVLRFDRDSRAQVATRQVEQVINDLIGTANAGCNLYSELVRTTAQVLILAQQIGAHHYRGQGRSQVVS